MTKLTHLHKLKNIVQWRKHEKNYFHFFAKSSQIQIHRKCNLYSWNQDPFSSELQCEPDIFLNSKF